MDLSETGRWLEQALLSLAFNGDSGGLELDDATLHSLVSYCEMAPPADASEYLLNIVGDDRCKDIVAEYLRRRGGVGRDMAADVGMQAYQKPRDEEAWSTGTKKSHKAKAASGAGEGSSNGSTSVAPKDSGDNKSPHVLYSGHGVLSAENIVQRGKRAGGKKGGKGISLAEASKGLVVFARSGPCNCQCTRHKLINNCLSCGRIVCEQEGEGPCQFCGVLVLREGSDYGGLEGLQVPAATEADIKAEEFKDRLVEYDRTAASRTTVIDDQSDYFEIEGNTWLSESEKERLLKRRQDEERIAEERRKRVVVTIDLLGRKVVMAGQADGKENAETISILESGMLTGQGRPVVPRVKPNPYLAESPIFVKSRQDSTADMSWSGHQTRNSSSQNNPSVLKSERIQHDDPLVEALIGHNVDVAINDKEQESKATWQAPKARSLSHGREDEEEASYGQCGTGDLQERSGSIANGMPTSKRVQQKEEALGVNQINDRVPQEQAFDICLPHRTGKQKSVKLAPSKLMQKQAERKEALSESHNGDKQATRVLLPGMILLKRWLTSDQQVDIIKYCRTVGKGPGGFYKPGYGEKDKMHLQMMCLGMQWEPGVKSYAPRRIHHDNALAPPLPDSFVRLVENALLAARVASTQDSGGKSTRVVLDKHSTVPEMTPDVCIVNFYQRSGNLGMHQDKDESAESLKRGCPVVSFSIGDTAEFIYGKEADLLKAEKVLLESGDILVFGGPSRMIYHGVTQVIPDTSPQWLLQRTDLRPGRLNLTFRQFS